VKFEVEENDTGYKKRKRVIGKMKKAES